MVGTEVGSMAFSKLLGSAVVFICDNQIDPHQERLVELRANWRSAQPIGPYGITGIAAVDIELATNTACWGRLLIGGLEYEFNLFFNGTAFVFIPVGEPIARPRVSCADLERPLKSLLKNGGWFRQKAKDSSFLLTAWTV